MRHIAPESLDDLPARIEYLSLFLDLNKSDGEALLAAKPYIAPLVPAILDAVYVKLLSFDITAKAFVPKNTDYEGETVKSVEELTVDHPQIALRKDFLKELASLHSPACLFYEPSIWESLFCFTEQKPTNLQSFPNTIIYTTTRLTANSPPQNYLVKLVSTSDLSPASPFWKYLLNVAIMHTGQPGFKHREKRPELRVEYIHMGALLGYVVDIVLEHVLPMDGLDIATKTKVIRALNKVVWIQNDLFAKVYLDEKGDTKL
ncbi:Protoglobin-domain-containing protein [Xylogone sp. PMI_703]|nr:Protoglobin-domain-containing protein [Xylogone sp. PMI_703]